MTLWKEEEIYDLLKGIIDKSNSPQIEVGFRSERKALTRFAGNAIHQSTETDNLSLTVRIALGQKIGCASANQMDSDTIRWLINRATENAKISKPNPYFSGFLGKTECTPRENVNLCESTANASPAQLAEKAHQIIQKAKQEDFEAAGSISTCTENASVLTSNAQFVHQTGTSASALTVINRAGQAGFGTGYSEFNHRSFGHIDSNALAEEALRISKMNRDPQTLSPGTYQAVLTPVAVSTLIFYLSWMSFHATVVETDQSFIANRFGEEVLDRKLSVCEDAHHSGTLGRKFDWEGYPKQRTDIIVNGRANAVVHDTISANKVGGKSTGNALGHDRDKYYSSPMTENLIVQNKSATIEDMIKDTDYGIYINRFWYVREINFKDASVTGMTRDGTFLIRNGKIDHALHNLRFSVSLVDIFSSIESIGDKLHLSEAPIGTVLTPAMKLRSFFVSGSSVY